MTSVIGLWGFSSFIFFKIALDFALGATVAITCAMLLGLIVGCTIFQGMRFYAFAAGKHFARIKFGQRSSYFLSVFKVWLIIAISNILLAKMIVFGFSKELNSVLGRDLLFDFSDYYLQENLIFSAVIIFPVTLHFLAILHSVLSSSTKPIQNSSFVIPQQNSKNIDLIKDALKLENNKIFEAIKLLKDESIQNRNFSDFEKSSIDLICEEITIAFKKMDKIIDGLSHESDLSIMHGQISNIPEDSFYRLHDVVRTFQKNKGNAYFLMVGVATNILNAHTRMVDITK